ncbi:hypothetical protein NDU88_010824 [Pleurodeles waltl]|uniref:Uncharacterized protein n=1 Tax=Pleurodeles waltl TaxID=8319 RepID=A0AAV7Q3B6_PLEWA|nr:hypothetical protein NDU88_010824 [Pleurodeles waltl]
MSNQEMQKTEEEAVGRVFASYAHLSWSGVASLACRVGTRLRETLVEREHAPHQRLRSRPEELRNTKEKKQDVAKSGNDVP